jgi:hypothetical protein
VDHRRHLRRREDGGRVGRHGRGARGGRTRGGRRRRLGKRRRLRGGVGGDGGEA